MHTDILIAERTPVRPIGSPVNGPPQTASVLKELQAAKRIINDLSFAAINQLDQEGMYSLTMAEGLIAGAIAKLLAAGMSS